MQNAINNNNDLIDSDTKKKNNSKHAVFGLRENDQNKYYETGSGQKEFFFVFLFKSRSSSALSRTTRGTWLAAYY